VTAERPWPARRGPVAAVAALVGLVGVVGLVLAGPTAARSPSSAVAASPSSAASPPATSGASIPAAAGPPSPGAPTPRATPVSTAATETTTAVRRPLPGWAIAIVAVLAVGGAIAAYPVTRGR